MPPSIDSIKLQKCAMIGRFGKSDDVKGSIQLLTTLLPLMVLWWVTVLCVPTFRWVAIATVPLITLLTLRVFALMHECGHGSLFRSHTAQSRGFGFVLGVVAGMPQYVWSRHHDYHHTHNGNWEKYRGPYTTHVGRRICGPE